MGTLFDRYPGPVIRGRDVTIKSGDSDVFVSDRDRVFCYTGICLHEEGIHRGLFAGPYYMRGKHSTAKKTAEKIRGFYRVADGCIYLDEFLDGRIYGDGSYKRIDAGVRLPGVDTWYGVLTDHQEDQDLTRAVFGLSCQELQTLTEAYARGFGICNDYLHYPRLTRSARSVNFCDMTDVWIPEKFPYIAFHESNQDFSHVSLWGFYRHIQLLTGCHLNSAAGKVLLQSGADEALLDRVFNLGRGFYYQTRVTKNNAE